MGHREVLLFASFSATSVHLEQGNSMQRLLAHADEVAAHPGVDDPLLGDHRQVPVHLEDSSSRGDHYGLLPSAVQVAVDEVFLKCVQRDVENLKKVSLSCSRVCSRWNCDALSMVIFQDQLLVVCEGLSKRSQCWKPVVELLILNHNPIEVLIESTMVSVRLVEFRFRVEPALVVLLQALLHVFRKI